MIGGAVIKTRKLQLVIELMLLALALAGACAMILFGMRQYYRAAYPLKYTALIESACERRGLDPALVYAVVHTESGFRPDVVSSVGARGLMQLMPDAFDWVQMRRGLPPIADKDILFDPETNVEAGTSMLRLLQDELLSNENVLSAYHAGRGSVNSWLKDPQYAPDGKQVTNIPFADTRAYVAKVLRVRIIYQKLYGL